MHDAAQRKGIRHAIGLQGRVSPSINYVKDLIADGYVGKPLSATLFVNAAGWGATLDRAYQADFANGANLMTITGGHNLDALCYCRANSVSCRRLPSASATGFRWKALEN